MAIFVIVRKRQRAGISACLLNPPIIQYSQSHKTHMDGIPAFTVCICSWLLVLQSKANGQRDSIQENTENGIDGNTERTDLLWPKRQCALWPE